MKCHRGILVAADCTPEPALTLEAMRRESEYHPPFHRGTQDDTKWMLLEIRSVGAGRVVRLSKLQNQESIASMKKACV
jgi:predicted RNA-binding protein with PUA-like domain